jgi:hypothetical protein
LLAEPDDVLAEAPDVVVIATGGVPNDTAPATGRALVVTSWDVLTRAAKLADNVLLYDDNGAHPGMMAAELIAESGARLEVVTPERTLAPVVGGINYPAYFRAFARGGATITLNWRLKSVRREGNKLVARLWNEYGRCHAERRVDQVVVEAGTLPLEDLYFALKPLSRNLGEIDHKALIANRPQAVATNPAGGFTLWRIGDAISARNIHAAIYDAIRLLKDV